MTTKPASPKQIKFIRDLLTARPAVQAQYGIENLDAWLDALAVNPAFTTTAASGMIDQLKGLPVEAAPAAAATAGMPAGAKANRYPGKCRNCKGNVAAEAGYFVRDAANKVVVYHLPGQCPEAVAKAPEAPLGLYCPPEGPEAGVWRLYIGRQSGRRQAAALVVYGDHGVFEYQKGGTIVVDQAVHNGALRPVTQDEAHAFGSLHNWCVNCGLGIEDDRSIAAGYGPVCAENNGWWYPTHQEAAEVLQRPVTKPSGVVCEPVTVTGPRCPACTCPLNDDTIGEPCYQSTPDYRGLYPLHTSTGLADQA